jgi:hypothetical protein
VNPEERTFRDEVGIPKRPDFLEGPAPRPADYEQVRAYYAGTLDAETREDVARLMVCYEEWSEAEREVLLELAAECRESSAEEGTNGDAPGIDDFGTTVQRHSSRGRRAVHTICAIAVSIAVVVGIIVLWDRGPREVATLMDGDVKITKYSDRKVEGTDSYPVPWRSKVEDMIDKGKVNYPRDKLLFAGGTPRGSEAARHLRPVDTVVRSQTPTFAWPGKEDIVYRVRVYRRGEEVLPSDELEINSWKPNEPLERGLVYSWTLFVVGETENPIPDKRELPFKVLGEKDHVILLTKEEDAGDSHLVRTALFIEYGLLGEAREELRKLAAANPNSELVESLLESIDKPER